MIRFIVQLYLKKPAAALVLVLLVGLSIGGTTISYLYKESQTRQKKQLQDKDTQIDQLNNIVAVKDRVISYKDSLYTVNLFYIQQKANDEVHDFLVGINREQAYKIKEQEKADRQQLVIKRNNSKLINKNQKAIKALKNDEK